MPEREYIISVMGARVSELEMFGKDYKHNLLTYRCTADTMGITIKEVYEEIKRKKATKLFANFGDVMIHQVHNKELDGDI